MDVVGAIVLTVIFAPVAALYLTIVAKICKSIWNF